ncbi:MAG: alpha/beta hydrolase family esterase [Gammaproteobacteria bacterium]
MKLNEKLFSSMRAATRTLAGKGPKAATSAIQDALKVLAPFKPREQAAAPAAPMRDTMRDINPPPQRERSAAPPPPPPPPPRAEPAARSPMQEMTEAMQNLVPDMLAKMDLPLNGQPTSFKMPAFDLAGFDLPGRHGAADAMPGQFVDGTYTNHAGTRTYKLYIPSTYEENTGEPVPLVVMLHGCTQDPDDFATGTQMNQLAEEMQCLVVYPAQSQQANPSRCWNWFNAVDQRRDQGEPSIIAGITRTVMDHHRVDPGQVYVAGLSAGGAMATIMGTLYPDLYAAVGVHSGLPFASAQDLPSALAAMKGNFGKPVPAGRAIPIIVFHGDRDTTVHPVNGDELIRQGAHPAHKEIVVEPGEVPNGYSYTRRVHRRADGAPHAEHWTIHGAGHAWSGGNARGSYTDGKGPDASREMMRFFRTKR